MEGLYLKAGKSGLSRFGVGVGIPGGSEGLSWGFW